MPYIYNSDYHKYFLSTIKKTPSEIIHQLTPADVKLKYIALNILTLGL